MIIKGLIEHVEGTVRGQTQYRRKNTMVSLEIPKLDEAKNAKKVESHQNENFGNDNTTPLPPNGQMTLFN